MNLISARTAIDAALAALLTAKADLATEPETVLVRAGDNLQAALDHGGAITLEPGAVFAGTYVVRSDTVLVGSGAAIRGATGPALIIPPGTRRIAIDGLELASGASEVVTIGANTSAQQLVEGAPSGITLSSLTIPTHRGKRGIANHGADVHLLDCEVLDCWDPAGQDSQAVYTGNTPGPLRISGGRYSAGSEVLLFGGDATAIPNVVPASIFIEGVELFRPASWQTDGVARKVKNIFECKNATDVILRKSLLHGCWAQGQAGEAIMLTPDLDGDRKDPPLRSGEVSNVLIEDVTIADCASVANLAGRAYRSYTVNPLTGIVFRRLIATVSRAQFGGRGQLAILAGEPGDVTFEDCTFRGDGTSTIYYQSGNVIDPVTRTLRLAGKLGRLSVTNSRLTLGVYGFMLNGVANAAQWPAAVESLTVTGNTFTGSTVMRKALPDNVYA
jgi:hypothetical protein